MSDGSIIFDTRIDESGFNSGTVAMGSMIGNFATKAIEQLASVGKEIISTGAEFETSLAKLSTIADTDVISVAQFSEELRTLSAETGVAAADLANVAYNAISAGTATEDAMGMVAQATKLSVAGFTDADSALSVLTTAINAYGDAAGTAEEISDSLIQVQNLGVTTVGDLASSMGKAIATGSAYGVNLGNIESAYISMTKGGIATAEATTYMSSMMKELGDSGSDVAEILKDKTGKSFGQLMTDGASLGDVLGILYDSCNGDAEALMNLWGSAEAGKASNAILNQGLDEFNKNLENVTGSLGSTEEAYGKMADTFEFKMSQLKMSAANVGMSIFESIASPLTDLAQVGINAIDSLVRGFQEGGVKGLAEAGYELLQSLADGFRDNFPVLVEQGVNAITQFASGLIDNLPEIISKAGSIVQSLAEGLYNAIPLLISGAGQLILAIVQGIISNLPSIAGAGAQVIARLHSTALSGAGKMFSAGIQLLGRLAAGLIQAVPALIGKIPSIISRIKTAFTSVNWGSIGSNIISGIANGIRSGVSSIISAASSVAQNALNAFKSKLGISSPSKVFKKESRWIPEGAAEGVEQYANLAGDAVEEMSDSMINRMDSAAIVSRFNNAFDDLQTNVRSGSTISSAEISFRANNGADASDAINDLSGKIDDQAKAVKKLADRPVAVNMYIGKEKVGKAVAKPVGDEQARLNRISDMINGVK